MKTGPQFQVPASRKKSFIEWIDRAGFWQLVWRGAAIYLGVILLFSLIELLAGTANHFKPKPDANFGFCDLIYFNFITILTIGYGDISPVGIFRLFAVLEAIAGLAIYSLTISIITIKILLPRKDTIVFSKYAYFCTDDDAFMIIYLNTARQFLTNLETSWYFKLNEDWQAGAPSKVPFITTSVQTFYLKYHPLDEFKNLLHPYDSLRIGLSGNLGPSDYSTFVQYDLGDILVIENRRELTRYPGFYDVDKYLGEATFEQTFHYDPPGAVKLSSLVKRSTNIY